MGADPAHSRVVASHPLGLHSFLPRASTENHCLREASGDPMPLATATPHSLPPLLGPGMVTPWLEISFAGVVTRPRASESGHAHSAHLILSSRTDLGPYPLIQPLSKRLLPQSGFRNNLMGCEDYLWACTSQILALRKSCCEWGWACGAWLGPGARW